MRPTAALSTTRGRWMLVALAVTAVAAAVLAAWLDWRWWEAYRGLTITLWAGGLLLAAGLLATIRPVRRFSLVPLAAAIGLLIGQNLGPARPELLHAEGVATISVVTPATSTATTPVSCARDAGATELSVSGDPNLRLALLPADSSVPADIDDRAFVSVSWTVGDRWHEGTAERADRIALLLVVQAVRADAPATRMASGPDSSLALDWTGDRGSLRFADLVHVTDEPDAPGPPIDLAGTISWTC